jgi:hypothetical protein
MKFLPIPGEELNIILKCIIPLMVPKLISTEQIKHSVRPAFENVPTSPIHFILLPFKAVLLYMLSNFLTEITTA